MRNNSIWKNLSFSIILVLCCFNFILAQDTSADDWVNDSTDKITTNDKVGIGVSPTYFFEVKSPGDNSGIISKISQPNSRALFTGIGGTFAGQNYDDNVWLGYQFSDAAAGGLQFICSGGTGTYQGFNVWSGNTNYQERRLQIVDNKVILYNSNINLNSNYISNDGDDEGIIVEDDGDVKITHKIGIGIFPTSLLTLNKSGTGPQTSEITIKSNNTDVARYGWNAEGYMDIKALYNNNSIQLTPAGTGNIQFNGNIKLNSNFISNDGSNEGVQVENDGDVMVSDKLGINTSPLYPIHSRMGSSGAMPANSASDDLVLETNNNTGISLLCPNTGKGCILFGSNTSVTRGRIYYDHQIDEMSFFTREHKCLSINFDGKVCIGPSSPENDSKLTVAGKITAQDITIKADAGADFVFEKDYALPSLDHVEQFVKENKHLPEIPSAQEMQENGVQVSEMQTKLLQKIEEMTLYMIDMKKEISELKNENQELRTIINSK